MCSQQVLSEHHYRKPNHPNVRGATRCQRPTCWPTPTAPVSRCAADCCVVVVGVESGTVWCPLRNLGRRMATPARTTPGLGPARYYSLAGTAGSDCASTVAWSCTSKASADIVKGYSRGPHFDVRMQTPLKKSTPWPDVYAS